METATAESIREDGWQILENHDLPPLYEVWMNEDFVCILCGDRVVATYASAMTLTPNVIRDEAWADFRA